jgi:hypothetical protein
MSPNRVRNTTPGPFSSVEAMVVSSRMLRRAGGPERP